MNYLSHYVESQQSELFKSTGAFFAFSNKQFDEHKIEGIKYASMGSGMICPKESVKDLRNGLDSIYKSGIEADIKENGIKAIIHRELANHECQITSDISDAVDNLIDYPGITRETIQAEWPEFIKHCIDNDYF
jgi:hypothetical protein